MSLHLFLIKFAVLFSSILYGNLSFNWSNQLSRRNKSIFQKASLLTFHPFIQYENKNSCRINDNLNRKAFIEGSQSKEFVDKIEIENNLQMKNWIFMILIPKNYMYLFVEIWHYLLV